MTGKEMIIYILQNNLENEEIFKDGKLVGFVSIYEAAVKLEVGMAAVKAMIQIANAKTIDINGLTYVSVNDLDAFGTITTGEVLKKNSIGGPLDG